MLPGRGSRSIFLPDSEISGGIIGRVRQKGVPNTNFTPTQESPTLTPLPPLAKIGDQLYHGGGSNSSDATLNKKCPHQRITYPLGSMTQAFLFMCWFCCKRGWLSGIEMDSHKSWISDGVLVQTQNCTSQCLKLHASVSQFFGTKRTRSRVPGLKGGALFFTLKSFFGVSADCRFVKWYSYGFIVLVRISKFNGWLWWTDVGGVPSWCQLGTCVRVTKPHTAQHNNTNKLP